jgi:hypothetical protein
MAMDQGVLSAIADAERNVPANVRALKRHFGVSDAALGAAFGTSRQTMNGRLTSATRLRAGEVAGFAAFFSVPEGVLYLTKGEAIRWCLDHPESGPPATLPADTRSGSSVADLLVLAGAGV